MGRIITAFLLSLVLSGCATVKATYEATNVLEKRTWEEVWTMEGSHLSISHKNGILLSELAWEGRTITSTSADGVYVSVQNTVAPLEWLEDGEKTFGHLIMTRGTDSTTLVGVVSVQAKQVGDALTLLVSKVIPIYQRLLRSDTLTSHTGAPYLLPDRKEERHYLDGVLTQHFVYVKKK
jgi:hypothetical protein